MHHTPIRAARQARGSAVQSIGGPKVGKRCPPMGSPAIGITGKSRGAQEEPSEGARQQQRNHTGGRRPRPVDRGVRVVSSYASSMIRPYVARRVPARTHQPTDRISIHRLNRTRFPPCWTLDRLSQPNQGALRASTGSESPPRPRTTLHWAARPPLTTLHGPDPDPRHDTHGPSRLASWDGAQ